ncbi:long-chain-acyl-CoA synthetase [Asticcacaulis sp. SL142]|uniref:long-chain-acyl-CoA synthetase n=1 Tax=Asticcacaulis sp. SL142 TaxID=2995155 RepID=UPI00226D2481|nr:long-chain-acyl-CoA synthetase [Asticcacaulis sp. SL142]WAC49383.1 long-chain-acyl-CoA synthetase [Asticcacaulis sp. SL142]
MNLFDGIKREFIFLKRLARLLRRIKPIDPKSRNLVCDDFERVVDSHGGASAIIFDGKSLTYRDLDAMANRYAHWARARGLRIGDTVALLMPNRAEYIAVWMGLNKVGVVTALINNGLTGAGLAHCINISNASHTIVDQSTRHAFEDIASQLSHHQTEWVLGMDKDHETESVRSLDHALRGVSSVRPDRQIRQDMTAHDTALYIYTSGTTGLPKAAKISNSRAQLYMQAFAGISRMKEGERIYITLPLYHSTGGLCGVGSALMNGAAIVLKSRFSATQFWSDIRTYNCQYFVYIGELCRYLVNHQSPNPEDETRHSLKMVFGNGMRPDVWKTFKARFRIPVIIEFYGSTEGNVSLFNFDGQAGAIGRAPPYLRSAFNIRLVKFDVEQELPERNAKGLCIECKPDEIGEAIGIIGQDARHSYSGYADKAASEKKILRDVFKKGDMWFRTGDLMKQDKDGYLYFVDRIGDTFRFKGENVSTSEVGEVCAGAAGVDEAIVYGVEVPHYDGKAGMVALIVRDSFKIEDFCQHVLAGLPTYARPRFVRLLQQAETTGTFKYKKMDLVKAGFEPAAVSDPLFVMKEDGGVYEPFDAACYGRLISGSYRL